MKNNKNLALKTLLVTAAIGAGTLIYKKFIKKDQVVEDDILKESGEVDGTTFEIKINPNNGECIKHYCDEKEEFVENPMADTENEEDQKFTKHYCDEKEEI